MMKRALISLLLAVTVALVAGAQVERHEINVGNFSRLTLIDDINVNYRCNADSAGMVVVTCSKDVLDHILFNVSDKGRLSIQLDEVIDRKSNLPLLTVYSSSLIEAENDGDSTLRIMALPPMKAFKVRLTDNGKVILRGVKASQLELHILSGKGKIIAEGSCDDLSLRLVGTGEIQADQVEAVNVSCRIFGTGSMGCNVLGGELKVSGSGTGKVYYKGNPSKVSVRKLGTIKAIPME